MSIVKEVEALVREYHENYRNPTLEVPVPSELYYLERQDRDLISSDCVWPAEYPNAKRPGIYVLLDADGDLLYVGKADNLGYRLSSYFRHAADKSCEIKDEWEPRQPNALFTVPVSEIFEAYSLEQYLIERLRPPANKQGIRS